MGSVLIETKLCSPRLRSAIVPRPRLVEGLASAEAPIVAVVAPPGYGKTTLLAQWQSVDERPFASKVVLPNPGGATTATIGASAEARPSTSRGRGTIADRSLGEQSLVSMRTEPMRNHPPLATRAPRTW